MRRSDSLMAEHHTGQRWDFVDPRFQWEIMSEILRDDGFTACLAGVREPQFDAVFTHRLADLIEARHAGPEAFRDAARSFAAAAYALVTDQLYEQARDAWEMGEPDYDTAAEAQARYSDYVAMVRS